MVPLLELVVVYWMVDWTPMLTLEKAPLRPEPFKVSEADPLLAVRTPPPWVSLRLLADTANCELL